MRFRRSELLLAAYFIYVGLLAVIRPITPALRLQIIALNAVLILWSCLFAWAHRGRGFQTLDHVRDWYPLPLLLLAYREAGWLALPHLGSSLEQRWVVADRLILYSWGLKGAIEALGPILPFVLELAYLLVYAVPVAVAGLLYVVRARNAIDDVFSVILLGTLTAYAMYPFFPSEPPRTVFPAQDIPVHSNLLRTFNLWIVGGYGIHTSVFPSGHTAAAFSSAFGMWRFLPHRPALALGFLLLAMLIGLGAFYGRYHYAVDVAGGFATACAAWAVSGLWDSQLIRRRARPECVIRS